MLSFMLAMCTNPEIQRNAQKAVDLVTERRRLPDFGDLGSIPYLDAILNEVLRWNPVVPLGVPHYTTADDVYKGYFIPKGTIIMGNSWAILHSEHYGADTEKFRPERFLDSQGKRNPAVPDPEAAFGYGRRICPGRGKWFCARYLRNSVRFATVMARENMWIMMASILSAFDINKAVDVSGSIIEPSCEYSSSLVWCVSIISTS